jgi:hypothetical protein
MLSSLANTALSSPFVRTLSRDVRLDNSIVIPGGQ